MKSSKSIIDYLIYLIVACIIIGVLFSLLISVPSFRLYRHIRNSLKNKEIKALFVEGGLYDSDIYEISADEDLQAVSEALSKIKYSNKLYKLNNNMEKYSLFFYDGNGDVIRIRFVDSNKAIVINAPDYYLTDNIFKVEIKNTAELYVCLIRSIAE